MLIEVSRKNIAVSEFFLIGKQGRVSDVLKVSRCFGILLSSTKKKPLVFIE
jgi:hypothetical protein